MAESLTLDSMIVEWERVAVLLGVPTVFCFFERLWVEIYICSAQFLRGAKSNDLTCPDYIPSIFGHTKSPVKRRAQHSMSQYDRRKDTYKKCTMYRRRHEASQALLLLQASEMCNNRKQIDVEIEETYDEVPAMSTMTDITMPYIAQLEDEIQSLCEENRQLKSELEAERLTEKAVKTFSSNKIKYFTGLPSFVRLMAVFNLIASHVPNGSRSTVPQFQQFFMLLMKLRLNLGKQYLAYRFNIHNSTVSRYFRKWIEVMYLRLRQVVKWPSRGELLLTMPMSFRKKTSVHV